MYKDYLKQNIMLSKGVLTTFYVDIDIRCTKSTIS